MRKEELRPIHKPIRWTFFFFGAIATLAYRIIIVLNFYSPVWVKVSWYIGTVGFILYFGYLYHIQHKRAKLITDYDLIEAVNKVKNIKSKQKDALSFVVRSTYASKARWNSLFIFSLTLLALAVGITLDLIGA